MNTNSVELFDEQPIRTVWVEEKEEWYFSIVDVVGALTEQVDYDSARRYWRVLKHRMKEEGNQLVSNCNQLKLKSPKDGKNYCTDVADAELLLRIIQSVPSPKAEPFKMWLAQLGKERIDETVDPEYAINRALSTYSKKGYSEDWIHQRILSIRVRNELTEEWKLRGVEKVKDYAILTDEITHAWSGMTTRQYKDFKGLKKENLRDNMSTTEIILNMLAETATKDISAQTRPETLSENIAVAKRGGGIAGNARKELEEEIGVPVVTSKNAKELNMLSSYQCENIEIES